MTTVLVLWKLISRVEASWPAAALIFFMSCNQWVVFLTIVPYHQVLVDKWAVVTACTVWGSLTPDQQFKESYPVPDTELLVWRPMASGRNIIPCVGYLQLSSSLWVWYGSFLFLLGKHYRKYKFFLPLLCFCHSHFKYFDIFPYMISGDRYVYTVSFQFNQQ